MSQPKFGLPGGSPDTADSEYLRAKIAERTGVIHPHTSASFSKRGNDVWAERSGRSYYSTGPELAGGAMDYASPVAGNGSGRLSNLTGGKKPPPLPRAIPLAMADTAQRIARARGGAADTLEVAQLMAKGARANQGLADKPMDGSGRGGQSLWDKMRFRRDKTPVIPSGNKSDKSVPMAMGGGRAEIVKRVMKERGVLLPEASKIVKAEGLY